MKQAVWAGMFLGSIVGGFVPMLWNGGLFANLIFSTIGSVIGIIVAYKMTS